MDYEELSHSERQILGVAVEDWFALWEIAATQEGPDGAHVEQARAGVKHLLDLGLVELARFIWPDGEHRPALPDALDDDDEWQPEREEYVIVGATEAGRTLYLDTDVYDVGGGVNAADDD